MGKTGPGLPGLQKSGFPVGMFKEKASQNLFQSEKIPKRPADGTCESLSLSLVFFASPEGHTR